MTVVFDRPYEFVPPDRGTLWPWMIQRLRLVDRYLQKSEGIVASECRHVEKLSASAARGDGIMLVPNHSRYSDPLAMAWPARISNLNFFAMASWHLFNTGWFDTFAMRKCGAFSLNREGTDRKSLETAIDILANAERPLILYPEGMTYRTNDWLRPLLDGVTFVARSAARRRAKQTNGQVVMHPVAIKYLCQTDMTDWATQQLEQLESHLGWRRRSKPDIVQRTIQISDAMLSLNEIEYFGEARSGDEIDRRNALALHLLITTENRLDLSPLDPTDIRARARTIRSSVSCNYFKMAAKPQEQQQLQDDALAADLAQELVSYPNSYLQTDEVTDTRVVETIQRLQETLLGKPNRSIPLKTIIEFGDAIVVPPEKAPRGQADPVLVSIADQLTEMLKRLATEARPLT